jgi:protease-4
MSSGRYDRAMKWMLIVASILLILLLFALFRRPTVESWQRPGDGPRIGIVTIAGIIVDSDRIVRQLDQFNRRGDIEAIVLRIDSPGGTVAASQEIYGKVRKISEEGAKPIIASLGAMAASGGYYIAIGADSIMAGPGSATGSIGVIFDYPVASELMNKIGIQVEVIKSGSLKDAGSPFREPTEYDRQSFQRVVDDLYEQFLEAVQLERDLPLEQVSEWATGEIFSGRQALELGMIDLLGDYEDALELAGSLTGNIKRPIEIRPAGHRRLSLEEFIFGDRSNLSLVPQFVPQYLMR